MRDRTTRWRLELSASVLGCALLTGGAVAGDPPGAAYEPDNTGRNVRDRSGDRPTADDQSNAPGDLKLTQQIRKAVVADDSLSTNAHNVKIVAVDGVVTLRGPVDSAEEKKRVAAKAQQVAGVRHVNNQLEVTSE
jgi:hyperosmotically inducible periplasmic protein